MSEDFDVYLRALNNECDGELDLDRIEAQKPIPNPCAFCGWSLDGHKYTYGARREWFYQEPKNEACTVHLSCRLILVSAAMQRAEAEVERLRGVIRGPTV